MFGIKQKTEEWYNVRKKIITATDVAIILECNPYMKKSELLYNKINDITTVENNIIKWGEEYEDIIAEFYSKIKKVKVDKIGLIIHNDYKWLGASPDGIINNNKLLEIKCIWSRNIGEEVPLMYWIQVQIQLEVCNIENAELIECIIEEYTYDEYKEDTESIYKGYNENKNKYWRIDKYKVHKIRRDKSWFLSIKNDLYKFWNDINKNKNKKRKIKFKYDDSNKKRCLRSDTYIVDYITHDYIDISNLVNKGNGILDWLNLYGDINGYIRNRNNSTYKQYLLEKGNLFKNNIIENLDCIKVGDNNTKTSYKKYLETLKHIKNKENIINNAVLIDNKNKIYGLCDLLVRIGYIKEIYSDVDIDITPFNVNKYIVVGIKYIKIYTTEDNYYKGDKRNIIYLTLCNKILSEMQDYNENMGYIIGRNDRVAKIKFDEDIDDHIEWYKELKENGKDMKIEPSDKIELCPNMKLLKKNMWSSEINRIANKYKEITLIRGISYRNRNNAYKLGYKSYDKLDSKEKLREIGVKRDINLIHRIIKHNTEETTDIVRPNSIEHIEDIKKNKLEFYVDFELSNSLKGIQDNNIIFLIGFGWVVNDEWKFKSFIVNKLTTYEEKKIIKRWFAEMNELKRIYDVNSVPIYHWSNAEVWMLRKSFERHNRMLYNYNDLQMVDLLKFFIKNKITVKGALNYSIKSIVSSLNKYNEIDCKWDDSLTNGLDAIGVIWDIHNSINVNNKIKRVLYYNEIDCKVMYKIVEVLRNKYKIE